MKSVVKMRVMIRHLPKISNQVYSKVMWTKKTWENDDCTCTVKVNGLAEKLKATNIAIDWLSFIEKPK